MEDKKLLIAERRQQPAATTATAERERGEDSRAEGAATGRSSE